MSLTIRKKGNKDFRHESPDYKDYAANDIKAEIEGNVFKIRSFAGRVIFNREGYHYSDITVYDVGGSAETFSSVDSFWSRLIALGYPILGGSTEVELNLVDGGTP